jgi:hypothetical protein
MSDPAQPRVLTEEQMYSVRDIAKDMADECACPDPPPCCDDCGCWRDAMKLMEEMLS